MIATTTADSKAEAEVYHSREVIARMLHCGPPTVEKLRNKGHITGSKFDGDREWSFAHSEWERFKQACHDDPDCRLPLNIEEEKVYTAGDIARFLKCSARTVAEWCDAEPPLLENYKLPGIKDRRITHTAWEGFKQTQGIP